jgi:hypothetical protein
MVETTNFDETLMTLENMKNQITFCMGPILVRLFAVLSNTLCSHGIAVSGLGYTSRYRGSGHHSLPGCGHLRQAVSSFVDPPVMESL